MAFRIMCRRHVASKFSRREKRRASRFNIVRAAVVTARRENHARAGATAVNTCGDGSDGGGFRRERLENQ